MLDTVADALVVEVPFIPSPIASVAFATSGSVERSYDAHVAFSLSGQVSSMQMAWSWGPWEGTTVVGGAQR